MDANARTGPAGQPSVAPVRHGPGRAAPADPDRPPSRWRAAGLVTAWTVCGVLVVAGVVAVLTRPYAPDVPLVNDATRWFGDDTLDRIAAYRGPVHVVVPIAVVLGAVAPLLVVTRRPVQRWLRRFPWASRRRRDRASGMRRLLGPVTQARHEAPSRRRIVARAVAVAVGVVALQDLVLLPWRFWLGFVHAGNFGLRTQGLGGWTVDRLIANATQWVGVAVIVAVVVAIVLRLPRAWPPVVAAVLAGLSGVVLVLWPLAIEPLRFDFAPLPPGPTRAAVEQVAETAGYADARILVADASRRTTRRNAYVSGIAATRRVVLYDTLLELPDEEVAAVVAHEFAHARNNDLLRGWLAGAAAIVGGTVAVAALLRRAGSDAAVRVVSDAGRLAIAVALALLLRAAATPVVHAYSRAVESSADATALDIGADPGAVVDLQRSLAISNLSDPTPPRWWVLWRATHPPAGERLLRAELAATNAQG